METLKVSLIIVTYYSRDLIVQCINSIYENNDLSFNEIEIIVVDNSNDDEHLLLKDLLYKNISHKIKIIHNPKNGGYGQGNNIGAKISQGNIIGIINPDVRLQEPLFQKTISHFENKMVSSVGFQQKNNQLDYSFFHRPEFFFPLYSSILTKFCNKNSKFIDKKFYLSGALVFFRKSDFFEIGMYDETMFMYLEETDIANRINKINKISVFDPSKNYIHLMEQKESFNEWLLDVGVSSIKIYFKKHNFNLHRYLKLRILENYLFIMVFYFFSNKARVNMAKAYIKALKKGINDVDSK